MNLLKDMLQAIVAPVHGAEAVAKTVAGKHASTGHQAPADFTFNPNPNTNIPNSTHDANLARAVAGNHGLMRQLLNVVAPHLTADNTPVQGATNPGYTPLQDSGFGGMGYAANLQPANVRWQNTDGQLRDMVNPQVSDNGYYYN